MVKGNRRESGRKTGNDQEINEKYERIEEAITVSSKDIMEINENGKIQILKQMKT